MNEDKELDFSELLEEIGDDELIEEIKADERFQEVTDENVNDFVLEYGSRLVKDGMNAIDKVKPKITSGQNADEISALSELMRAMNATLGTLAKISLQNKKDENDRNVLETSHQNKKELTGTKTQVVVGTREEIFKKMLESVDVIDVEEVAHEE